MARPIHVKDEDARVVQLAFEQKQCAIHAVRGTAKWRRCIKCGVLIMMEEDDGPENSSHY